MTHDDTMRKQKLTPEQREHLRQQRQNKGKAKRRNPDPPDLPGPPEPPTTGATETTSHPHPHQSVAAAPANVVDEPVIRKRLRKAIEKISTQTGRSNLDELIRLYARCVTPARAYVGEAGFPVTTQSRGRYGERSLDSRWPRVLCHHIARAIKCYYHASIVGYSRGLEDSIAKLEEIAENHLQNYAVAGGDQNGYELVLNGSGGNAAKPVGRV